MSYLINITYNDSPEESYKASDIEAARSHAVEFVHERMAAFSEDRQALADYGFLAAEEWALDVPEAGGECKLQDGWQIEVMPIVV